MFVQLNMAILPLMATTKYHLTEAMKMKRAELKGHIKEQGPHLWQKQVFQKKKKLCFKIGHIPLYLKFQFRGCSGVMRMSSGDREL